MGQEPNTPKIDRGRSILNATDENANPYGLVLSENERGFIYAGLNRLDNRTNAILNGKNGWKQQAQATVSAIVECSVGLFIASVLSHFLNISVLSASVVVLAFIVLQKLNLLLTSEKINDTFTRQEREDKKEAKERAKYFKDVGSKDLSL